MASGKPEARGCIVSDIVVVRVDVLAFGDWLSPCALTICIWNYISDNYRFYNLPLQTLSHGPLRHISQNYEGNTPSIG